MGFNVVLRTRHTPNYFRQYLLAALNSGEVDKAIICSGFFQELPNYGLSRDTDFTNALLHNSISLLTLGIHNRQWRQQYDDACLNLRNRGVNILGYISRHYRWHAKIFIAYKKSTPILAIVGSSNMTNPAFGGNPRANQFNYEADVIFWNSRYRHLNTVMKAQRQELDNLNDIFLLNYFPKLNGNLTTADRLTQLSEKVDAEIRQSTWVL